MEPTTGKRRAVPRARLGTDRPTPMPFAPGSDHAGFALEETANAGGHHVVERSGQLQETT
ncbi:MAG TPA: hypothetical protein VGV36_01945 [Solirubrobacteraceae bacterium]|nr:hypothetical protein [Solirubrobacteraceae bacterium]